MEANMTDSKQLAGLIGPALIALAVSETLNLGIWRSVPAESLAPVTYLNGTILFVVGLAVVRAHNRWRFGWPVLVTLVGWIVMLGGLYRMLAPSSGQLPERSPVAVYAVFAVIFVVGAVLAFIAYRRDDG
jgi:hypothetical protein